MVLDQLKEVFKKFKAGNHIVSYTELASGHINDTYLIKTDDKFDYVLQRINKGVFKESESKVIKNIIDFKKIKAKDIMTPRTVMTTANENMAISVPSRATITSEMRKIP